MQFLLFTLSVGVRRAGLLSLSLLYVYVDPLINNRLRQSGLGCEIKEQYFACPLYADDMILLSVSVNARNAILNINYRRDAMLARYLLSSCVRPSVHPSVRP